MFLKLLPPKWQKSFSVIDDDHKRSMLLIHVFNTVTLYAQVLSLSNVKQSYDTIHLISISKMFWFFSQFEKDIIGKLTLTSFYEFMCTSIGCLSRKFKLWHSFNENGMLHSAFLYVLGVLTNLYFLCILDFKSLKCAD